jgi:hypothetical protein
LVQADTSLIFGTGEFLINANASTLIFDTASFNGFNGVDFDFRTASTGDLYAIGSDADPAFEAAYTFAGDVVNMNITFPLQFGTIRPRTVQRDTFHSRCGRPSSAASPRLI